MLYTTFNKLKNAYACSTRYRHLAKALGGITKYGADTPISLETILDINGLEDAVWALRACVGHGRISRLFACRCAEEVLPIYETYYPKDKRPRTAIEVARLFADNQATREELRTAAYDVTCAIHEANNDEAATAARAACESTLSPDYSANAALCAHLSNISFDRQTQFFKEVLNNV